MEMTALTAQILGGLYGQALGDAWAMPALLHPDQTWAAYGGWITTFHPAPDDHIVHSGFPAGRVTDDSEQAFALAQAMIDHHGVTLAGTCAALIAWYDQVGGDTSPYVGPSTRRGVQALKRGEDPNKTGLRGDTNGAAMRVSPVGLIHPGDLEGAVADACLSAIPTHNTDIGFSGAAAVAGAIAIGMTGASLPEIIEAGQHASELGRARGVRWFGASIAKRIGLAVQIADGTGTDRQKLQEIYDLVGCSLSMTESIPAAFGVLKLAQGDPQQAAIYAAALSGDADTIGAIACAIAGASTGISAFKPEVLTTLRTANPAYDIEGLAAGLAELVQHPNTTTA